MNGTGPPRLTLYTDATPNGFKISIALEFLHIPYNVEHVKIASGAQKQPWYLKINPNGRIPALTDELASGEQVRIFESGSILFYLAEQYDTGHKISYPKGSPQYFETISWLFFQNAGLGPMQGQAHHFRRYAPEKVTYGISRYTNETHRLYSVLETHLKEGQLPYLVGDHVTIADFSTFTWVTYADWAGIEIDEFPYLNAWLARVRSLPGVEAGTKVPKPLGLSQMTTKEQDEYASKTAQWIRNGP